MKVKENIDFKPIVSVVVITYNSSRFVLETLESIKLQTYGNIELIISDDASKDDTVKICKKWIEQNRNYLKRAQILEVPENTGIPSNVNRGVKASQGQWIKLIAGDDILLENCIQDNLEFVVNNEEANFVFSKPIYIDENSNLLENSGEYKIFKEIDSFYNFSPRKQYLHLLIKHHPINPPTLFYRTDVVRKLGGFDENFQNEDFPLYLKVTKAGYKLNFLNKETVKYRIHNSSFSIKVKTKTAISNWTLNKWRKTIHAEINWKLFLSNPLVVVEFYNRLFFYNMVILLGNTKSVKQKLTFIRWLSPLVLAQKFNKNF